MDYLFQFVKNCCTCCTCRLMCKSKCMGEKDCCDYELDYKKNNQETDTIIECLCCAWERHTKNQITPVVNSITIKQ